MDFIKQKDADNIYFVCKILTDSAFADIKSIALLPSGSRSFAYYVDDYIVRFPKAEIIWRTIQREKTVIDSVYPHLMPYFEDKIHKIELVDGAYPFSVSQRFKGKICDGRPESEHALLYQNLQPAEQLKLAQDLAMFFNLMHRIDYTTLDIPEPTDVIDNWGVSSRKDFDYAAIKEVLLAHQIDLDDYQIAFPNTEKALCHNDLSGSNMLINPKNKDVLTGIIDFGNTIIMPKYLDFFPLYKIHRKLAVETLKEYNKLATSAIEQKQADFAALCYIGYGLAQNKNTPSPYFMKLLNCFCAE